MAYAADQYVRDGASGDGSDWTNAWDDLPGALIRGDTYYMADGNYSSYQVNDTESGTDHSGGVDRSAADIRTRTG